MVVVVEGRVEMVKRRRIVNKSRAQMEIADCALYSRFAELVRLRDEGSEKDGGKRLKLMCFFLEMELLSVVD